MTTTRATTTRATTTSDGQQAGCDATKLTAGAVVSEAELKATPAGLVFEKIELVG